MLPPTKYQFDLLNVYWIFKPVTAKMELEYTRFFEQDPRPSWIDIMVFQLAKTFGGTNLNPKKLFGLEYEAITTDISEEELRDILYQLPMAFTTELWAELKKHYPFWGPVITSDEEYTEEDEDENLLNSSAS